MCLCECACAFDCLRLDEEEEEEGLLVMVAVALPTPAVCTIPPALPAAARTRSLRLVKTDGEFIVDKEEGEDACVCVGVCV